MKAIALAPIQVSLVRRHACAWWTKCEKSRTLQRSNVYLVTQRRGGGGSDIYDLEEDWEDKVSNLHRKVRVNVLLAGRKIKQ